MSDHSSESESGAVEPSAGTPTELRGEPNVSVDKHYIEYSKDKRKKAEKKGKPISAYELYEPYMTDEERAKLVPKPFGQRDEHGHMVYPAPTKGELPQGHPNYSWLKRWKERKLAKDKQGRTMVYGEYQGEPVQGVEDWPAYFKSFKDIGKQYDQVIDPNFPLNQQEMDFCAKYGFHFVKELGRGGYGTVYRVHWVRLDLDKAKRERRNKDVACKVMHLKRFIPKKSPTLEKTLQKIFREIDVLKKLSHKNVVKLEHVFHVHDPVTGFPFVRVLLFLELCESDLDHLLQAKKDKKFSEEEAREVMVDVCRGLEYLHSEQVVHFDIKPRNILYVTIKSDTKTKRRFKLTDFGLSQRFPTAAEAQVSGWGGTTQYKAPELDYTHKSSDAKRCDIFSLGSTLLEMLVTKARVVRCRTDFWAAPAANYPKVATKWSLSSNAANLVGWMTSNNSGDRPDIQQVIQSEWMSAGTGHSAEPSDDSDSPSSSSSDSATSSGSAYFSAE